MSGDLHCHTRLTDGSMGIEDIIALAKNKGVESVFSVKRIVVDAMMIAMCLPNVIVLYILCPEVKRDLIAYCKKYK